MNPTISQLNDPEWWKQSAPEQATHWGEDGRWYRFDSSFSWSVLDGHCWHFAGMVKTPLHKRPDPDLDYQETGMIKRSKYHRKIKPGVWIDVYDVIKAWAVDNPAQQHLIKKALQAGDRGHKSYHEDMEDIIASAVRAKQLNAE